MHVRPGLDRVRLTADLHNEAMPSDEVERVSDVVDRILAAGRELDWVEIKHNNSNPEEIGEYISALANSAALADESRAYMLWGVEDETFRVLGTSFDPRRSKKGNEDLLPWLTRLMSPKMVFSFTRLEYSGNNLVLLEIDPASSSPVRFKGAAYVRIGPHKKSLAEHPEHERKLWHLLSTASFESIAAAINVSSDSVLKLLDHESYFELADRPRPQTATETLEALENGRFITRIGLESGWTITNLGALAFARDLSNFESLERRAPRVVLYDGSSRVNAIREQVGVRGYANGFSGLIAYINANLPHNEFLGEALRKSNPLFPQVAVRELVANALIHQDLTLSGSSPVIEIFDNRLEVSNPGIPIVPTERFIDSTPLSRNEKLASLMRKLGICEERGSGWDKIAASIEMNQLPAPLIYAGDLHTKVSLFGPKKLVKMDRDERIRALYQHACLRYVLDESTTNSSVRKRFGLPDSAATKASRLIAEAMESGVIVPYDPTVGAKARRYLPFWAAPSR